MKIFDNGWFRVNGMCRNGRKSAHYFFNDKPIHSLRNGLFKEEVDFTKRYSNNGYKCKTCIAILNSYDNLENRCVN